MARRLIIGNFADGGCGMRVSQPGYDADANPANNLQLAFNSDWTSMLPIWETGSFHIPPSVSSPIQYNFVNGSPGFVPFFVASFTPIAWTAYDVSHGLAGTAYSKFYSATGTLSNGGASTYLYVTNSAIFWDGPISALSSSSGSTNYGNPTDQEVYYTIFNLQAF